jgi:hypothetical protein
MVMRMDRVSAHEAPAVTEVLCKHEVLMLHGPARTRTIAGSPSETTASIRPGSLTQPTLDDGEMDAMLRALNEPWPRPSLGWRTAAALWNRRRSLRTCRRELRHDVVRRTTLLRTRLGTIIAARIQRLLPRGSGRSGPGLGRMERRAVWSRY